MLQSLQELNYIWPLMILGAGIVLMVLIEISTSKSKIILPWFAILVLSSSAISAVPALFTPKVIFGNMLATGGNTAVFYFVIALGAVISILSSVGYLKKYGTLYGEYYILLVSAVLGMMLMAGARDLFMVFAGLEIMSICFYVLAGINRRRASNNEASLKYFLLGSFATGFVVYGIGLIYGASGTTNLLAIASAFPLLIHSAIFIAGMVLLIIGFSFKIAAFPFHMWAPDVYQGAATTVSGFMATCGKVAAFSVLITVISAVLPGKIYNSFQPYFAVIATLSMLFGSIVGIAQTNLKRMLAYSSIAHAGYMLIGLATGTYASASGIIFYLAAYTFMNLGAFGIIALIEGENEINLELNDYAGLSRTNPGLAALMALFMFALSGIPPFAGFFGKYYVFMAAIKGGLTWLALVGVAASSISVFFYLRLVVYMYFKPAKTEIAVEKNYTGVFAVSLAAIITVALGLYPQSLIGMVTYFFK
jgi:NADH-quinone oxidoreductase subunit N